MKIPLYVVPVSRCLQLSSFPRQRQHLYIYYWGTFFMLMVKSHSHLFQSYHMISMVDTPMRQRVSTPVHLLHPSCNCDIQLQPFLFPPGKPLSWHCGIKEWFGLEEISLGSLLWNHSFSKHWHLPLHPFLDVKLSDLVITWDAQDKRHAFKRSFMHKIFCSSLPKGKCDVYENICPTVASLPHQWDLWERSAIPRAAL